MRYYRFTNSEPSKLGSEPLPDGDVKAFRLVTDDRALCFCGSHVGQVHPVNESVEMELGNDSGSAGEANARWIGRKPTFSSTREAM